MKAIMIMFDSLNQHMLPPYGCEWVHAPNFERLAGRCATFDNSYVGSMPCMPARRDLHTGGTISCTAVGGCCNPLTTRCRGYLRRTGSTAT